MRDWEEKRGETSGISYLVCFGENFGFWRDLVDGCEHKIKELIYHAHTSVLKSGILEKSGSWRKSEVPPGTLVTWVEHVIWSWFARCTPQFEKWYWYFGQNVIKSDF